MAGIDGTNGHALNGTSGTTNKMADSLKVKDNVELIRVPGGKHKYMNPNYKRVQQKMYDYTCDIRLKVDTEIFQAHREVLSQASDYFAAMFSVDMREKEQDCIELKEISPKGFSSLLEYFYHGHITIITETVEDIIEAARFFQVDWLLDAVTDFLVRHLSMENYDEVLDLSDKYFLGDLRASIFHHIGQNFERIAREGRFNTMSFELFQQLLSEDYFIAANEEFILKTVTDWCAHDLDERQQHIVAMMKCIRFRLVDPKAARHLPDFISDHKEVQEMVATALEYHENIASQCLSDPESASVRGSRDVVALIPADDESPFFQYKVPGDTGFFSQKSDIQELDAKVECASVVCLGNFLFVVGGYSRQYTSSGATYRYDPRTISWLRLTDMRDARVTFGLCAGSSCLVAAGGVDLMLLADGTDQEVFLDSVEHYRPLSNEWVPYPDLPFKCYGLAIACAGETIYTSGGVTDNPEEMIPINYCLSYCPGDEVWTPRSPMLIGRKGHSMTSLNGKLYVIGGSCAHTDVTYGDSWNNEMYDLETDQWTSIACLTPDYGHIGDSTVVVSSQIYVICGTYASRYLAYYDTETDEFSDKEYCGMHLQKLAPLRIGLPRDFYANNEPSVQEN